MSSGSWLRGWGFEKGEGLCNSVVDLFLANCCIAVHISFSSLGCALVESITFDRLSNFLTDDQSCWVSFNAALVVCAFTATGV